MAANDYHFITHWKVQSTVEEIYHIILAGEELPRWWPSVYLRATVLHPGDATGLGKKIDLHTKGFLPYTLRWGFELTEVIKPQRIVLAAQGDFNGRGIWEFRQNGSEVEITFDWKLTAEKPVLRYLSPVLKPIFSANHEWAMAKGLESLQLELKRKHAKNNNEKANIPRPPGRTFPHNLLYPV